ncbi:MAG: sodium:solute symporter family protein [Bryobacteraceae bacterium]|nr:sodium:solute symporter family protein [Solibacteraceae bacterium]MCO5352046.1 sodium:solute symporter family protein [Bryobacteraceae bacterium]
MSTPFPPAFLLAAGSGSLIRLSPVDLAVIVLYFVAVLGIGFYLKAHTKTGDDFFMAGRDMTAWVAGLSFLAANLGSLELMGWAAAAYQYGILATHWYWIGAIPAMLFLGVVMMPFYYISKTHSVPGYLKLRFDERSRALSAITFGLMTVLMSGINMYSMALVMKVVLGWDIHFSIWVSSLTVAAYVFLGGLLSAIFNEVLQFVLIWLGAMLVPIIGLIETGGWAGMVERISRNFPGQNYTSLWSTLGSVGDNPMGIHWTGIVLGLGWVISFGYWTTDFLVVQRVMTAKDLRSAKMAPIIGAAFKMLVPFIVIVPGLLALAVLPMTLTGEAEALATGGHSYNEVLPLMLARYLGPGLLGLGVTALIAGFMSGMAGNVSAFATVWTYDIYRALWRKDATDAHYVSMGRWCTVLGVLVSIGTAYLVMQFASIMDYVQALFSFFIAPLFGTVILGMLWKRCSPSGGFWGLLAGTVSSIAMWAWVKADPGALRYIAFSPEAKDMAENMYRALWSWLICVGVTVAVTYVTKPKPVAELAGLVYGVTPLPDEGHLRLHERPMFWAIVVSLVLAALNIYFW